MPIQLVAAGGVNLGAAGGAIAADGSPCCCTSNASGVCIAGFPCCCNADGSVYADTFRIGGAAEVTYFASLADPDSPGGRKVVRYTDAIDANQMYPTNALVLLPAYDQGASVPLTGCLVGNHRGVDPPYGFFAGRQFIRSLPPPYDGGQPEPLYGSVTVYLTPVGSPPASPDDQRWTLTAEADLAGSFHIGPTADDPDTGGVAASFQAAIVGRNPWCRPMAVGPFTVTPSPDSP